eukprot:4750915-Pleurochrysis_carterae.AAC.1
MANPSLCLPKFALPALRHSPSRSLSLFGKHVIRQWRLINTNDSTSPLKLLVPCTSFELANAGDTPKRALA